MDRGSLRSLPEFVRPDYRPPLCPGGWRKRRALIRAIQDLPAAAGAAAELQLRGYTVAEIAEEVGCTAGTVTTRLSRATARLRTSLAGLIEQVLP